MAAFSRELVVGTVALIAFSIFARYCNRRWKRASVPSKRKENVHQRSTGRPPQELSRKPSEEVSVEDTYSGQAITLSDFDGVQMVTRILPEDVVSTLELEVVSGPSSGKIITRKVETGLQASITIGRLVQNTLALNDPEVSGTHAVISWNSTALQWELVDLGSLNGTKVNGRALTAVALANNGQRHKSLPVRLRNGDSMLLGPSSQIQVKLIGGKSYSYFSVASSVPFGVGNHAEPMRARKGGDELPMEDVSFCEWPLEGVEEFGAFCIFDGHCGRKAAEAARRIMASELSSYLGDRSIRDRVLANGEAADILRRAFRRTEDALNMEHEGCTATVLLIWNDPDRGLCCQCGNVGDSACYFSIEGKQVPMSQDHRVVNPLERARLAKDGHAVSENNTRIAGMNLARALGDKFLKSQDVGLSAEPAISEPLHLGRTSSAVAVIASDGLWDVLAPKTALQILEEALNNGESDASKMAEAIVTKAGAYNTRDNTTAIVLNFQPNSF